MRLVHGKAIRKQDRPPEPAVATLTGSLRNAVCDRRTRSGRLPRFQAAV